MIGNVVSIMWLLFMTIALVMMSVMAYTSIKTDFGCLRDVKELKSLRKLVKEQSETIENRERRIIELEQELDKVCVANTQLYTALCVINGENTKEENESISSELDTLIYGDSTQKLGE